MRSRVNIVLRSYSFSVKHLLRGHTTGRPTALYVLYGCIVLHDRLSPGSGAETQTIKESYMSKLIVRYRTGTGVRWGRLQGHGPVASSDTLTVLPLAVDATTTQALIDAFEGTDVPVE